MALVSMKRSTDDYPKAVEDNEYGYGLCISLGAEQCEALKITKLPEPGTAIMIRARAVVTRTSVENDGEGPENYMSLQITDMELGKSEPAKSAATMLYGDD